nr:hypothetical protein [Tanacetum cinerariifolium]
KAKIAQAKEISKLKKRVKKLEKKRKTVDPITTAGEVVTTASVKDSDAPTTATTADVDDELTLAKTLIAIKAAKPKVARTLEAEMRAKMEEEERIAREKDKANRVMIEEWDDVHAIIDANRQLEKQIQAQEREQLFIKERSRFLAELIESKRKLFSAKRAKEIRNKPPTKAYQKSLMCTYMRNIKGFKQKDFKRKSLDNIEKIFDKVYKRVNTFVDMDTKNVEESLKKTQAEGGSKRVGQELEYLEIVPEDDDDVAIEATPLSYKSPTIVDYKIYREGKKSYFKIIRADENLQNYLTFGTMLKNFNREDIEVLRSIVKERFRKTKPVDDMENLLFQTLKTMFKPHVEDIIWKYQQGAVKVNNWKLFDSCGGRIVGFKGLQEVTTAQLVLLVYKVAAVFNKVNVAKSRLTTAVRVSTAGWIKWLEDQDMVKSKIDLYEKALRLFCNPNTIKSVCFILKLKTHKPTASSSKDKGKAKMIEPEKPLKKDQIALDEEVASKLEAKMRAEIEEEERIAREKDEANRAMIEE